MDNNKVIVEAHKLMVLAKAATTPEKLQDIADEISQLVEMKNKDYGDAWQRYGIFTPLIRINDKLLRIKTLSDGREAMISNESIEDNLRDTVAYGLLALLYLDENGSPKQDTS